VTGDIQRADVVVNNQGTIFLFALLTDTARQWVEEHVSSDRTMMGHQLVVEHRYANDISGGTQRDGLVVI